MVFDTQLTLKRLASSNAMPIGAADREPPTCSIYYHHSITWPSGTSSAPGALDPSRLRSVAQYHKSTSCSHGALGPWAPQTTSSQGGLRAPRSARTADTRARGSGVLHLEKSKEYMTPQRKRAARCEKLHDLCMNIRATLSDECYDIRYKNSYTAGHWRGGGCVHARRQAKVRAAPDDEAVSRPCAALHRETNRPTTSVEPTLGGTCCRVSASRRPTARPRNDEERRACRQLDMRRGRGDGSWEHCCIVASTRHCCGRCHRADGDSEQLATAATGAAWKIGESRGTHLATGDGGGAGSDRPMSRDHIDMRLVTVRRVAAATARSGDT